MVKLVLFDIDGTLIRTGGAGVRAFGHALKTEFGLVEATKGMQFAGRTDTGLLREILVRHNIEATPDVYARFFSTYAHWLAHWLTLTNGGLCPGLPHFLGDLRAVRPRPMLGLLTGNIRLGAEIKLRHYQLWEEFEMGAFADDFEHRNHIAAFAHRHGSKLAGFPLRGEEVVVIGDTPRDIECGRSIGARVVAVATGGSTREELAKHNPDWLLDNLSQIDAAEICR